MQDTMKTWVTIIVGACSSLRWWSVWAMGTWAVCAGLPPLVSGCISRGPEETRCDAGGGEPICEAPPTEQHTLFGHLCEVCAGPCDVWRRPDVADNFTREDFEAREWAQIQGDLERVKFLHAGHAHAQLEAYAALVEGNEAGYHEAMRDVRDPSPDAVLRRGQVMGEPSVFGVKRRTKARRWTRAIDQYESPSTEIIERAARAIFERYESYGRRIGLEAERRTWLEAPSYVRDGYREMGEAAFLAVVREAITALARADNQFSHCPWCGLHDCMVECSRCGGTGPEFVGSRLPFIEPTALGRSIAAGLLLERADNWEEGSDNKEEGLWDAVRSELRFVASLVAGDPRAWTGNAGVAPPQGWVWVQDTSVRAFGRDECPWWVDLVIPRQEFASRNGVTVLPNEMVEDLGGKTHGTNIRFRKIGGVWQVTHPAPHCESTHFDDTRADPFECDGIPGHAGLHHSTWGNGDGSVFTTKWSESEAIEQGPAHSHEQPHGAQCEARGPHDARCMFTEGHVGDHHGPGQLASGFTTLEIWEGDDDYIVLSTEKTIPTPPPAHGLWSADEEQAAAFLAVRGWHLYPPDPTPPHQTAAEIQPDHTDQTTKTGEIAMDQAQCQNTHDGDRCTLVQDHTGPHLGTRHGWRFRMMCPHCGDAIVTSVAHESNEQDAPASSEVTPVPTGQESSYTAAPRPYTKRKRTRNDSTPQNIHYLEPKTLAGVQQMPQIEGPKVSPDRPVLFQVDEDVSEKTISGAVPQDHIPEKTISATSQKQNFATVSSSPHCSGDQKDSSEKARSERGQNGGDEMVSREGIDAGRKAWDLASFVQWFVQVCEKDTILYTPFIALTMEVGKWLLTPAPNDPKERPDPVFTTERVIPLIRRLGVLAKEAAGFVIHQNVQHGHEASDAAYAMGRAKATDAAGQFAHVIAEGLEGQIVDWWHEVRTITDLLAQAKGWDAVVMSDDSPLRNGNRQAVVSAGYFQKFMKLAEGVLR